MRIDYCPKCNKAGLKYERYPHSFYSNPPIYLNDAELEENATHHSLNEKWCPRCKEWIKPNNKPYIRMG